MLLNHPDNGEVGAPGLVSLQVVPLFFRNADLPDDQLQNRHANVPRRVRVGYADPLCGTFHVLMPAPSERPLESKRTQLSNQLAALKR